MNTITKIALLLMTLASLSACNTTKGFGQDVEAAGDKIEETAEDAQDEMTDGD